MVYALSIGPFYLNNLRLQTLINNTTRHPYTSVLQTNLTRQKLLRTGGWYFTQSTGTFPCFLNYRRFCTVSEVSTLLTVVRPEMYLLRYPKFQEEWNFQGVFRRENQNKTKREGGRDQVKDYGIVLWYLTLYVFLFSK